MRWRDRKPTGWRFLGAAACAAAAIGAVLVLTASSPSARADEPEQVSDYFGMNAQYVFKLPQADWQRQLQAIAALGIGVVRDDALWSWVERRPPVRGIHSYDWRIPDAMIAALAQNGLRWYPILDYSTPWDGSLGGPEGWKSAPIHPTYFAEYAGAFARRYGSGGEFWLAHPWLPYLPVQTYEVWNEPNLPDFWPDVRGAAARYGELLADAVPAIRAGDPAGHVTLGGLSPTGLPEFLEELEARQPGLIGGVDAVAFHPYGGNFAGTGARVRMLREWLDQRGYAAMPIEITETGWASPPLEEEQRASRMSAMVEGLAASSCGITRIIPYTWLTFESSSDPEEWFGIANSDASLKPTGSALASAIGAVMGGRESAAAAGDPCSGLAAPTAPASYVPSARPVVAPGPEAPLPEVAASTTLAAAESTAAAPPAAAAEATAAAPAAALQLEVHVRRRADSVRVGVICEPGCRSTLRLAVHGGARRSTATTKLGGNRSVGLPLPRRAGATTLTVTARSPGLRPRTVKRRLR